MSDSKKAPRLSRRVVTWAAQGTLVAMLAAGTIGYASANKRITVEHNGTDVVVTTLGATVADALNSAGITPAEGEIVAPSLTSRIHDGDEIAVRMVSAQADVVRTDVATRSEQRGPLREVTVVIDGKSQKVNTTATTVRGALQDLSVVLDEASVVEPGLDDELADAATITVSQATTATVTTTEKVDFAVTKKQDSTLAKGKKVVETKGVAGQRVTTYQVTEVDGKEVSRTQIASGVTKQAVDQVVRVGTMEKSTTSSSSGGSSTSVPKSSPVSAGSARAIAKDMVGDDEQFACLDALWQRESGWRVTAANSSSGAYGIPQALPGSKMASAGSDWRTSAATQIKWGLGYIKGRYGTPCGAWSFFKSHNWY
ncbi:G5 domain-containing protein [Rarobacter incanus]|uniref:Uncharacterized protein YabE (DUF348 family) n=1 Tax=Rarobacter incanus TaxID=153494 RepID=A0A542SQT0_9MICO|nr:G5 domain-containing protein [Rarobacter incanus]TQK76970.1 uncharacterized protein YabE (DUF348 family) [Rarobacter incanus]